MSMLAAAAPATEPMAKTETAKIKSLTRRTSADWLSSPELVEACESLLRHS
jgi:hypothetical protein